MIASESEPAPYFYIKSCNEGLNLMSLVNT